MEDHTLNGQALNEDTLNPETVDNAAPKEDTLYAGKYKSVEDLEKAYKEAERALHAKSRPQTEEASQDTDPLDEVAPILDKYMASRGYVRKEELEKEKYEQEQLEVYLNADPSARERLELIKTLAQTPQFKDKNYAEVDEFIKQHVSAGAKTSRPAVMGQKDAAPKTISEMSDEEWAETIGLNRRGYSLRKTK